MTEFRAMQPADEETVIGMMRGFYASPAVATNGSEEIFRNDVKACTGENPHAEGYIFEEDGVILGYGMLAKSFSTEYGKPCIWVEDLFIREPFRNLGIGSAFLNFVAEKYSDAVIRLEVEEENTAAVHTYTKSGFTVMPYMEMIRTADVRAKDAGMAFDVTVNNRIANDAGSETSASGNMSGAERPVPAAPIVMEPFAGYTFSLTGASGCDFFTGSTKLFSLYNANYMTPWIKINGEQVHWKSSFDPESTIVRGLTRFVVDSETNETAAKLVYLDAGRYEIITDEVIEVYCEKYSYQFYRQGTLVAEIWPCSGENAAAPVSFEREYEPWVMGQADLSLETKTKMLLCAFPKLRFAF